MHLRSLLRAGLAAALAIGSPVAYAKDVAADPNVQIIVAENGKPIGTCSGAMVNTTYGTAILTAGHCTEHGNGYAMIDQLGNKTPLKVAYVDHIHDTALMDLAGPQTVPMRALDLSCKVPTYVGETVTMTGYPLDLGRLTVSGKVASTPTALAYWPDAVFVAMPTGAGDSGSAVTDDKGRVVGILVGSYGRDDSLNPVGIIVPISDLCAPEIAQ